MRGRKRGCTLDNYRDRVEEMLDAGCTFSDIADRLAEEEIYVDSTAVAYFVRSRRLSSKVTQGCRNRRIDIPKCKECEYRHLVMDQYNEPSIYICTKIWMRIRSGCKSSPMSCPKRDIERDCEERWSG